MRGQDTRPPSAPARHVNGSGRIASPTIDKVILVVNPMARPVQVDGDYIGDLVQARIDVVTDALSVLV